MISKKSGLLFLLLFYSCIMSAQAYFQQEVNYTISVKLDDKKNELSAFETLIYKNNSPTPLSFIYMHLWPNGYKDNTTCLAKQLLEDGSTKMYFAKEDEFGYIDSLEFKVNGTRVLCEYVKDSLDICKLKLNEPLLPGASITITTPFHVKIPSATISRLGHIGQSYMITQWYPKPAVYDRNGWNYMPYLNQGEFYSEFGNYDVSITVPSNYVLAATGDITDGEKELDWLNAKVAETQAIITFDRNDMNFPPSDSTTKTLRFKQSNVHDFAWFCDKRYHVLKSEVITPHKGNKVTTWAFFTNAEADLWTQAPAYINDAIHYYSLWNGDYPYNNCTAVDGTISAGGGMEYPNITVIGTSHDAFELDVVITHEVGHNWFYGMLGSNERMHAWMDEGINSYNENRYVETKYPEMGLAESIGAGRLEKLLHLKRFKHKAEYELGYNMTAVKNEDQPIELPAYDYTETNYGCDVYYKSAIVFDYLRAYLGDSLMDKAMQAYFEQWHFKHPMPADFRKVMEETTGKDLSWFFDDLINSTHKLDYKIKSAHQLNAANGGTWKVTVKNTGQIKGPLFLQGIKDGKVISEQAFEGFDGKKTLSISAAEADKFKIDYNEKMPEINRNNNTLRTRGLFKKIEPVRIQFLGSIDNPDKSQLYYFPVVGWNEYNKGMAGIVFYNNLFPQKKLEFQLMPMWSFAQKDLAGYGKVMYNIFPNGFFGNLFQKVSLGATATRYDYSNEPFAMNFNKIAPEVVFEFKKQNARSAVQETMRVRYISIFEDSYRGNYDFTPPIYTRDTMHFDYTECILKQEKNDVINPVSFIENIQSGKGFEKISLTFNYSHNYSNKNKSFDIRLFAGTFIGENKSLKDVRFRLSGQRGYQDYLYDNIYLGRSELVKGISNQYNNAGSGRVNILANQFTETDGGFKFLSYSGQTSNWIIALNLKSSLGNAKIPLNVYVDVGTTASDANKNNSLFYDAGVYLSLPKKIFEIYFPLLLCNDFKTQVTSDGWKYIETIRFTLNLNLINPFGLINNFKL